MRGLSIFSCGAKYEHPPQTPQSQTNKKTIFARLKRVFRGPPKPPSPQLRYRDEKKYKHVPTHSASSFTKTTTTGAMVAAVIESKPADAMETEPSAQTGPTEEQLTQIDRSLEQQPTTTTTHHESSDATTLGRTGDPLIQLDESPEIRTQKEQIPPAESLI